MTAGGDIAIVGLACRFPGADDIDGFWANLREARESSTPLTDDDLTAAGVPAGIRTRPTYVRTAFTISDVDRFDARFFGVSAEEARMMDPQQRILLEIAYAALEDAGQVIAAQRRPTGVFAAGGGVTTSYLFHHAARLAARPHGTGSLAQIGNDKDFLATRLSFKLNLTGLSVSVQTACSSSLVALHLARSALLVGDVDLALVGASCVRVPQRIGYDAAENPLLSRDGHCRPFADAASGTVFGSGAGAVVLKRHEDAIRDRDHVYALLKSTATTNDGGAKIGYTASSVPGQARAMARAIAIAGISARDVSYVECHGTATRIGDPLELKALERVFRLDTDAAQACGIGSVKSNIGHLEQAAGIAGLIKVALMLKHRTLVPSLNCARGNAAFDFARSPFGVVQKTGAWTVPEGATHGLVAGLNSLGIGGTNGFAILAEAEAGRAGATDSGSGEDVVCLSARTPEQLHRYLERMAAGVERRPDLPVRAFCRTVNASRSHHRVRCAGVVADRAALAGFLREASGRSHVEVIPARRTVYVCNPSGAVSAAALDALKADPRLGVFRDRFEAIWPGLADLVSDTAGDAVADACRTVAVETALCLQLQAWGIRFDAVTGTGLGRVAAQLVRRPEVGRQELAAARAAIEDAVSAGRPETEAPSAPDRATHTVYRTLPAAGSVDGGSTGSGSALATAESPLSLRSLLTFLAQYLAAGGEVDWERYYGPTPVAMMSLPTYPFSRDRHWLDE